MSEEEDRDEGQQSLYSNFPDIDETALQCLTPFPTGEEYMGQYFADLYYPASTDELVPSVLSKDPFMSTIAQVRSKYAFVFLLQQCGAFSTRGKPLQTISNAMACFSSLYPLYCATIIQRAWRSKRKTATKEDRLKFGIAMITRPTNGQYLEERETKRNFISQMLSFYPPPINI